MVDTRTCDCQWEEDRTDLKEKSENKRVNISRGGNENPASKSKEEERI